ncbi:MAG: carbonic anhydrase [Planctomycetota bacterium]
MINFKATSARLGLGTAMIAAWLSLSSCSTSNHCDTCSSVSVVSTPAVVQTAPVAQAAAVEEAPVKNADEALKRLMEGNKRFVTHKTVEPNDDAGRRAEITKGQAPFATIFSCVDSRVPPEMVFDRGLGDLFVTRTAGQVADRAVLGSIEYGAEHLHIHLIMVMGHTSCGAVKATIETVEQNGHPHGNIGALIESITPAVTKAKAAGGDLFSQAIRTNVELTVERLKKEPVLAELIQKGELKIVGGVYNLATGEVELTAP